MTADQESPLPNMNSGARADAPVFVSDALEFGKLETAVYPGGDKDIDPKCVPRAFLFLGFASAYAFIFAIAESVSPQFYRAWLDFCMPLVEYVSGLSPRAGEMTEYLIAEGYPERVDDVRHCIAMSRVLAVAMFVFMAIANVWVIASYLSPVFVSCTRGTRRQIMLFRFIGVTINIALSLIPVLGLEFFLGELKPSIVSSSEDWKYSNSNIAMLLEVLILFLSSFFLAFGAQRFAIICRFRYNITTQQPGDKS